MPASLRDRLVARLIRSTTIVDRSHRAFDRARSMIVARFASDGALARLNELAYNARTVYASDSPRFRSSLFHWEGDAFDRWMPPPPARLLVGGAGGGREAFGLRDRGYEVVAFEPSPDLARGLNREATPDVQGFQARYEDLPLLCGMPGGPPGTSLDTMPRFQAAVFGWASYSHLRTYAARVDALQRVSRVTDGPILVSFYTAPAWAGRPPAGLRRWLDRLGLWSPTDRFTPHVGFYHLSTVEEIREEARAAGLEVVHLSLDDRDGRWPHAILAPSAGR